MSTKTKTPASFAEFGAERAELQQQIAQARERIEQARAQVDAAVRSGDGAAVQGAWLHYRRTHHDEARRMNAIITEHNIAATEYWKERDRLWRAARHSWGIVPPNKSVTQFVRKGRVGTQVVDNSDPNRPVILARHNEALSAYLGQDIAPDAEPSARPPEQPPVQPRGLSLMDTQPQGSLEDAIESALARGTTGQAQG